MDANDIARLVKAKLKTYQGKPALFFKSGRLDYEAPYIFLRVTPSGNVVVGEITSEQGGVLRLQRRVLKPVDYQGELYLRVGRGTGTEYLTLARAERM
jgi:hypothetical protein